MEDRSLTEEEAGPDPLDLFGRWFEAAVAAGVALPEAMTLATATAAGRPSARMVLLKGFDAGGFVFYTNYGSRKARELDANPRAALALHWASLERQVRIEGRVERTSDVEAAAYFESRPRDSRISAWASPQSREIDSREDLEELAALRTAEFAEKAIPLPPFWGGYRVIPDRFEFWQGRHGRLHDRISYTADDGGWTRARLAP